MSKKRKRPMSRNMRIRRAAETVIMVCLALIVLVSGWKVFTLMHEYRANQRVYDDISGQAQKDGFTGDIDFAALRKINPDVIGWLYYEDSMINYPVVQGEDNDKYLHTMFDGNYGDFGTLFADAEAEDPFRQFNTVVYGHHMKNGSMFAGLKKLKDQSYCLEHPQLELITPEGKFHLQIWAFLNQPSDSGIYRTNISDKEEREEYISMVEEYADYMMGLDVKPEDRLVVLSTCAYEYRNARYMVVCKMVPWEGQNIEMGYDKAEPPGGSPDASADDEEIGDEQ